MKCGSNGDGISNLCHTFCIYDMQKKQNFQMIKQVL